MGVNMLCWFVLSRLPVVTVFEWLTKMYLTFDEFVVAFYNQ
ncbi:hypothetical protein Nizo2259_1621 [Lactiplantibacillus plantarum]|uniref:Uncharacterized protein n=2 Tax=Lactiplantibacillus plantarum TaxID=1590 RepID=A0A166Q336_LACPN|nr:hypothetical protein LPST_C1973 [Lactiplantibacillus plantarum ST-III]AGL64695.2 hypothetical protein LBP_cg1949 [Lactiplantibacillus plantarum subsp. plantarum P-8]ALC09280.1 hypothetical protein JM48_2074 [Lactiplantibacillus plantarum]ERO40214.1 hypothetical protein LPLWJ_26960 [Lactiplantibacillus plantarum WJL]KEZ13187.1 hypothetical protein Lp90_2100 [Lactiplantibacillus plantarum]